MELVKNPLTVIVASSDLKIPQGVRVFFIQNKCFVWVWSDSKIHIYNIAKQENKIVGESQGEQTEKHEMNLSSFVIDIFEDKETIYVMVENGILYSFQNHQVNYMEVEDLFSSPSSENASEWKETIVTQFGECDRVKRMSTLSSQLVILAVKDEKLVLFLYSMTDFKLKFIVDLDRYQSQDAVLSSCAVASLSQSLKQQFEENLEVFDEEILVIGLDSGLLLWLHTNNPIKGTFVLFNTFNKVQSFHWIKDSNSGLYTYLLAVLSSGQIVVFGGEKYSTLYLPDSVKSSCCLNNFIISSNFVDCYANGVKIDKNISLNSSTLPVKGVCAMAQAPGSELLLVTATVHGSIYCFNPSLAPDNSTFFTLPDQSILDNMFLQTQSLDKLYKKLHHEENIIKAVSTTVAANVCENMFQTTVKVVSDGIFTVISEMIQSNMKFLQDLWTVCVEVIEESGVREISFHKMDHDFSTNDNLTVNVNFALSVNDTVSIELVYFIENKQPLLIVPVGKVKVDACCLMCPQLISGITNKSEDTLEGILSGMENEISKPSTIESKLVVKFPEDCPVKSIFPIILADSHHRFTSDEWDKLSNGRKLNVSLYVTSIPVLLKLDIESRELIISSISTKMCHNVKEAVVKRSKKPEKKCIPESLTLGLQAIQQSFEIESLKETPCSETLDSLRKNLRTSVSSQLLI